MKQLKDAEMVSDILYIKAVILRLPDEFQWLAVPVRLKGTTALYINSNCLQIKGAASHTLPQQCK